MQAVGVYAASGWIVLEVVGLLRENLGLPRSVFVGALVLLALGRDAVAERLRSLIEQAWVEAEAGVPEVEELRARSSGG